MKNIEKIRILSAAAWAAFAVVSRAATYYVATSGSDATGLGTEASPYATIQKAINTAATGDTVLVAPGNYASGYTDYSSSGHSRVVISKDITVRSTAGAARTWIVGAQHSSSAVFGTSSVRCVYMTAGTLDGFTLTNGFANALLGNVAGANGGGIAAPESSRTPQVNNCIITGCGAYRGGGAYWGTLNNCTVVANYAKTDGTGGIGLWGSLARNSIVYNNKNKSGDDFNYGSSSSENRDPSYFIRCDVTPSTDGTARDGGNNIAVDPAFSTDSYALSSDSPCLNAGDNSYVSGSRDAAGNQRIIGNSVDIGAYEYPYALYRLTVVNGTGSGTYINGTTNAIVANAPPSTLQKFAGWAGATQYILDRTNSTTSVVMPAAGVTVVATYSGNTLQDLIGDFLGLPQPVVVSNVTIDSVGGDGIKVGTTNDNGQAWISCIFTNAGTVIFPWSVSCETYSSEYGYGDRFIFSVDGVIQAYISGSTSGVVTQYVSGAGEHTLLWKYEKDGSDADGDDAGTLQGVTWIPQDLADELGSANHLLSFPSGKPGAFLPFPYGFQACFLDGAAPAGAINGKAVKLGGLDTNGAPYVADSSSVSVAAIISGAGTLAFNWYASSQSSDILSCMVDGEEIATLSGNSKKTGGWKAVTNTILTVGSHTVVWKYAKGESGFTASDCGWIDNVTWDQYSYTLTVAGGTIVGSGTTTGSYSVGSFVTVKADAAPEGMEFDSWDGEIDDLGIDSTAAQNTFAMAARDITMRAIYRVKTVSFTIVNGRDAGAWPNEAHDSTGEPEGAYPPGALVRIVAEDPPLWQKFVKWTASTNVVFSNAEDAVTMFVMPQGSVTITATYTNQTDKEKLASALTVSQQPFVVDSYSASGIVAVATGGIRYNDPVVKFGGASVPRGSSASLTTKSFTGKGTLYFWWHSDTEASSDGLVVKANGVAFTPVFSKKAHAADGALWTLYGIHFGADVNDITFTYTRDETYLIHEGSVLVDRMTWIPQAMIDALGGGFYPNVNNEFDPFFMGRDKEDITGTITLFQGEDGGTRWVESAPDGQPAVQLGLFGTVTNSQYAQVSFTNYGPGVLTWDWTTRSETAYDDADGHYDRYDNLAFFIDWVPTNKISGKVWNNWRSGAFVEPDAVCQDADSPCATYSPDPYKWHTYTFRYQKDEDVSVFEDCGWVRNIKWTPAGQVSVSNGTVTAYTLSIEGSENLTTSGLYVAGSKITVTAADPAEGYYFTGWNGTAISGADFTKQTMTFTMPTNAVQLVATYGKSPLSASDIAYTLLLPDPLTFSNVTSSAVGDTSITLGSIGDSDQAWVQTVYTNAGTIIFRWSVSSEQDADFFKFYLDGKLTNAISGVASGVVTQFIAGAGAHTLKWAYEKDMTDEAFEDHAVLEAVTWIPKPLADELGVADGVLGFPNGRPGDPLPFPYGYQGCYLDTTNAPSGAVDNKAVRLGGRGLNSTTNSVSAVVRGAGTLAYRVYVSCEKNSDYLHVYIDGSEVTNFTGNSSKTGGWAILSNYVNTVGSHIITWQYAKDGSGSTADDSAWIDNVQWTQNSYTVTVDGGAISPEGLTQGTYLVGESVMITAGNPPAGKEFKAWTGEIEDLGIDASSASISFVMPSRNITLTATWRAETRVLTVVNGSDAGGYPNSIYADCTGEPEGSYPAGALVRIVAAAAPQWQIFDHWVASVEDVDFADKNADTTLFKMPSSGVTVMAVYRDETDLEKLSDAISLKRQWMAVSDASPSGVVAVATGGVRYHDAVVRFGGPSVHAGESVSMTITNHLGKGSLQFWWHADAEAGYDGLGIAINGVNVGGKFTYKETNTTDQITWFFTAITNITEDVTSVKFTYSSDATYNVHDNILFLDRVSFIPEEMSTTLSANEIIPDINNEFEPWIFGENMDMENVFLGIDGGVKWDTNAPGNTSAVKLGLFGTVTNNAYAQVSIKKTNSGILVWDWSTYGERTDQLQFLTDGMVTNHTGGKDWNVWKTTGVTVNEDTGVKQGVADDASVIHTLTFRYQKDADVSELDDAGWVKNVKWVSTHTLALEDATITKVVIPSPFDSAISAWTQAGVGTDSGIIPEGATVTITADYKTGKRFVDWTGTGYNMGNQYTNRVVTFVMPASNVSLTAKFDDGVESSMSAAPVTNTVSQHLSGLSLAQTSGSSTRQITLSCPVDSAAISYKVQYTTSLGSDAEWHDLDVTPTVSGGVNVFTFDSPVNTSQCFFRILKTTLSSD